MTVLTRFPIFGRPKLSLEKYLAASSSFAFSQESCSLPEDLGQRFMERVETNLEASRQSVKDAGDSILAEVVPSAMSINVIGYEICCPSKKGNFHYLAMPLVYILMIGFIAVLTPFLLHAPAGLFRQCVTIGSIIIAMFSAIGAAAYVWKERGEIVGIVSGKWGQDSEDVFLSIANTVSVITVGGVYLSTDDDMNSYTNTFIPWSDIASVKMTHGKNGIELLNAEGETIAGLYHASTPTMTAEVIYDLVLDRLAAKRLR